MVNNIEFGVLFENTSGDDNYKKIYVECDHLTSNGLSQLRHRQLVRALADFDLEKAMKESENQPPGD